MRVRHEAFHTWKHACLKKSEKKPRRQNSSIIADQSLAYRAKAKHEHAKGEPDIGLELLEQHVGWYLEQDIRHEEDNQADVIPVVPEQIQFLGETEDVGV